MRSWSGVAMAIAMFAVTAPYVTAQDVNPADGDGLVQAGMRNLEVVGSLVGNFLDFVAKGQRRDKDAEVERYIAHDKLAFQYVSC